MQMKKLKINNTNYVVGYCRFSSDNQSETSIEAQQKEIQKYANEQKLIVIKWYIDRAQSGTSADRKEFQQMIDDSSKRGFGQVLVYQLDRFARDKEDHVVYKINLRRNGVKVISVTERFDDSPEGHMMESMIETMSAYYSQDLSRKTTRGMKLNAEKGYNNGGTLPYGYKLTPRLDTNNQPLFHTKGHALHDIIIDPEQAEAVKIMFQMTLDGFKRCGVIQRLNELGYKKINGQNFTGTHIDNILRNERYIGISKYHFDKTKWDYNPIRNVIRTENKQLQIVSKSLFESVQKILDNRKHRTPSNMLENYLLTGKVFCGECNQPYNGTKIAMKNGKYLYYKCREQATYRNGKGNSHRCRNNSVRKEDLEKFVIKQIKNIIFHENLIEQVLKEFNRYATEITRNDSLIELLENQIKDVDRQIVNIVNTIAASGGEQLFLDKLQNLKQLKIKITETLAKENGGSNYITATKDEIKKVYENAQNILDGGTFEQKKQMLQNFINKIYVYKDTVAIYMNLIPMTVCGSLDLEVSSIPDYVADDTVRTELDIHEDLFSVFEPKNAKNLLEYTQQMNNSIYRQNNLWLPRQDLNLRPIG